MPAMEPLCHLADIKSSSLIKVENLFIEAELFIRISDELKEFFRQQHKNYFCLMKLTLEMENDMLEIYFGRLLINDILSTGEYTLDGIAHYTNTHKEIIEEI